MWPFGTLLFSSFSLGLEHAAAGGQRLLLSGRTAALRPMDALGEKGPGTAHAGGRRMLHLQGWLLLFYNASNLVNFMQATLYPVFLAMTLCTALFPAHDSQCRFADKLTKAPADSNTAVPEEQTAATKEKGIQLISLQKATIWMASRSIWATVSAKPVLLVLQGPDWCLGCKAEVLK